MATTHTLTADTRMEDLPGLASGDTIALYGHVLTCESNLSAITGLYATGTGTIRLLDGGNCDFSGSNPLPDTVTIEGGTEDNPLPAHGDYGYPLRASASILLNSVYGDVVSHCIGNNARVQAAKVITATSSSVMLDRDMGLEAGDWIGVLIGRNQSTDPNTSPYPVGAWNPDTFTATCSPSPIPNAGSWVVLLTAGLHISLKNNAVLYGNVSGDEVGLTFSYRRDAGVLKKCLGLERLACGITGYQTEGGVFASQAIIKIGTLVTNSILAGGGRSDNHIPYIAELSRGWHISAAAGYDSQSTGHRRMFWLRQRGGTAGTWPQCIGSRHAEYDDCELPETLYTYLESTSKLVVRTTASPHPSCVVHRAGGIATLVDRTDIEVPTSLPDAWRLDPIEDGTAWHDVPMTVLPGKTLSCIWYWMLGEEGATAGCQILDGEGLGGESLAMHPGMADVLAETAVPGGASPLRPFVAVPISWRNPGREMRKVVLRGWARGGTAYSRIDPCAGGLA